MESANPLPQIYLARHGETAWSISGQHTGLTDIPLTPRGEQTARQLAQSLKGITFSKIFTSPLKRAIQTSTLAGFPQAVRDPDLDEWNYGDYEGKTTAQIHQQNPDWEIFRDGSPSGESTADVATRADRVVARLRAVAGNVLIFSHGHFLRVLASRWLGLDPTTGRYLMLNTAALSIVGYERNLDSPVIRLWNDCRYTAQ
jgi:broad specificity phosphatase PhoE